MGILGAILGGVGAICAALGIVVALDVVEEPIIHENFTWGFWFGLAAILFLAAITSLLGRRPGGGD
jgi:drug/metabolite transporter (DMT)-like permease